MYFIQAVRTALKKLEEKCSIEDAKAVCEPDVLNQVFKWKVVVLSHPALNCCIIVYSEHYSPQVLHCNLYNFKSEFCTDLSFL